MQTQEKRLDTKNLSMIRLMVFAAPAFVTSFVYGPLVGILPGIYAKYYGLDIAARGTVLLASRLFDAASDPVIGYLSDHTKTRIGPYKPWIIAGYPLMLFAFYALFVPPETVTITHFAVCFILFYLFLTMAEIPYQAWQADLSLDYRQRTRIVTYRSVSWATGSVLFSGLPMLPIFASSEFTPEVLRVMARCVIILLPPVAVAAVVLVPKGTQVSIRESSSLSELFFSVIHNKPFLNIIICFLLYGVSWGMIGTMGYIYFDTYLLLGDRYPVILIAGAIGGLLSMPFWMRIMNRFSRHRAWSAGMFGSGLLGFLYFFFEPHTQAYTILAALYAIIQIALYSGSVAPAAMVGDAVDFDTLKTGVRRSSQYYGLLYFLTKGTAAVGSGLGYWLLKLFRYDPASTSHGVTSIFGLKLAFIWIPSTFFLLAAIIIWSFPIDERRQQIIARRIQSRSRRAEAIMST
jgi:Na+/melibiose symporter-like transporter